MSSRNTTRTRSSSNTRTRNSSSQKRRPSGQANARKAGSGSRTSRTPKQQEVREQARPALLTPDARHDIAAVAIAVVAIALFIAVVAPGQAVLSNAVSHGLLLALGLGAYLVPFFLLAWAVSFFVHVDAVGIRRTGIGLLLIVVTVIALIALYTPNAELSPSVVLFRESALVSRGGYLGAGIAWVLITLMGKVVGTVILTGVIIAGLIVTGLSITGFIQHTRDRYEAAHLGDLPARARRSLDDLDFEDEPVRFDNNGDVLPAAALEAGYDSERPTELIGQEQRGSRPSVGVRADKTRVLAPDDKDTPGNALTRVFGRIGKTRTVPRDLGQGTGSYEDDECFDDEPIDDEDWPQGPVGMAPARPSSPTRVLADPYDAHATTVLPQQDTTVFGAVPPWEDGATEVLNRVDPTQVIEQEQDEGPAKPEAARTARITSPSKRQDRDRTAVFDAAPVSDAPTAALPEAAPAAAAAVAGAAASAVAKPQPKAKKRSSGASRKDTSGIVPAGAGVHACDLDADQLAALESGEGGDEDDPKPFILPDPGLLETSVGEDPQEARTLEEDSRAMADELQQTLMDFNIGATVAGWVNGPTVTQFKVEMPTGVRVNRITNLKDDIALSLAAESVRVFAPIPGTSYVGVEVPNRVRSMVHFGDVIGEAKRSDGPLTMAIGKDVDGKPILVDLAKMPHLLIAGTTGSGKSVAENSMIMSMLMRTTPDEVRMIMIDPKRVEMSVYDGIPHLYVPVVTEPGEAASALTWGTVEMERRFKLIQKAGTRNISRYNKMVREGAIDDPSAEPLPYLVIVIDELADLMMQARKEVETSICRIAQLGRAAGIHLIIATQRPSTDIVTGLIKSNITNRMALKVASGIDSRVIIDQTGAQDLLGHGDMLLDLTDWPKARRLQGCFLTDKEIQDVCEHLRTQGTPDYHEDILKMSQGTGYSSGGGGGGAAEDDDPLVWEAAEAVVAMGFGSTSGLQRRLKVGYSRAGRIMDMLEAKGIVGPQDGTKPREVLVDAMELESLKAFEQADADADWGGF